jgi:hypothetical protein
LSIMSIWSIFPLDLWESPHLLSFIHEFVMPLWFLWCC